MVRNSLTQFVLSLSKGADHPEPVEGLVRTLSAVLQQARTEIRRVGGRPEGRGGSHHRYPQRVVIVADGRVVAEHVRLSGKGRTAYDWQHYVPLVQRKPSALRNGAPFVDLPEPLAKLRQALLRHAGGDRPMAKVLALSSTAGLDEVLVAVELALEHAGPSGRVSPEHVANVLARLTAPERPPNVDTQLSPTMPVQADPGLYDRLRNLAGQEVEQEIDHR